MLEKSIATVESQKTDEEITHRREGNDARKQNDTSDETPAHANGKKLIPRRRGQAMTPPTIHSPPSMRPPGYPGNCLILAK